jgi:transcription-repair coupling factor (superfamily II helicase)
LSEAVKRLRSDKGLSAIAITASILNVQLPLVTVELPIPASIPAEYVPDKTIRLGLYRRMADMRAVSEVDALVEEFNDRFGIPPETVLNLFFQLKIKLLSEKAGLASVGAESGQIVLRFPEGSVPSGLPDLGPFVRVGKIALWMPYKSLPDWQERLSGILEELRAHPGIRSKG